MVNRFEDQFCGMCGMPVVQTPQQPSTQGSMANFADRQDTRQYTAEEIDDLLILRTLMNRDEHKTEIMAQNDIDKLFE
jgi:hypothetical protein